MIGEADAFSADRTQTPCYLETSTPGAVRFEQRHGFTVVHTDTWAGHS